MSNQESSDPGIVKLESQLLDFSSALNVVDSSLYLVPMFQNGYLFVRYMEQGIYKDLLLNSNLFLPHCSTSPLGDYLPGWFTQMSQCVHVMCIKCHLSHFHIG